MPNHLFKERGLKSLINICFYSAANSGCGKTPKALTAVEGNAPTCWTSLGLAFSSSKN